MYSVQVNHQAVDGVADQNLIYTVTSHNGISLVAY